MNSSAPYFSFEAIFHRSRATTLSVNVPSQLHCSSCRAFIEQQLNFDTIFGSHYPLTAESTAKSAQIAEMDKTTYTRFGKSCQMSRKHMLSMSEARRKDESASGITQNRPIRIT